MLVKVVCGSGFRLLLQIGVRVKGLDRVGYGSFSPQAAPAVTGTVFLDMTENRSTTYLRI